MPGKNNRYTFVIEFLGGTYVHQARGESPELALRGWLRVTSADELGSIFGGSWIQTDAAVDSCGWTSSDQLANLEVSYEQASDFSAAQILLSNPQQVTVAGHQAIIGDFLGPELYVQIQPDLQLLLQGILMDTTVEMHQKFIELATTMIGRM